MHAAQICYELAPLPLRFRKRIMVGHCCIMSGGCGSGGRAGHPLVRRSPASPVRRSKCAVLNPNLLQVAAPLVCECMRTLVAGGALYGSFSHHCMNVVGECDM